MKAAYGLIECWDGTVTSGSTDITPRRADEVTRLGMCYVPQRENAFPTLTVENLEMSAYIKGGATEEDYRRVWDRFPSSRTENTRRPGRCPADSGRCWRFRSR